MRNLEQRIVDAEEVVEKQKKRDERLAKHRFTGGIFANLLALSDIAVKEVGYKNYKELEAVKDPWERLTQSLYSFENLSDAQAARVWQDETQDLDVLNSDIENFVEANFRTSLPSNFKTILLIGEDRNQDSTEDIRLGIVAEGGDVYIFPINRTAFETYDDSEKALLLSIPGAYEEQTDAMQLELTNWTTLIN